MTGFVLESPLYLLLLCLPAALLAAWWVYYRNKNHASLTSRIKLVLFILRTLSLFFIFLLLTELVIKSTRSETQPSLVLVATDNSASVVSTKDSSLIREKIQNVLSKLENPAESHYSTRFIQFGSAAETNSSTPTYTEKETDFSQLFSSISDNYANQNIGALVLISDGIYNKGLNPLYTINRLNFPIYAIGTGDTLKRKDARIKKVNYNEVVTAGNGFMVETMVEANACKNETLTLQLLHRGEIVGEKKIQIANDAFFQPITFTVNTKDPGLLRYELKLTSPSNDANLSNNTFQFVVEALDNREKIIVLSHSPHPDLAALRDLLESTGHYEVTWKNTLLDMPPPKAWSLVIFHNFNSEDMAYLNQCRAAQIPVFIINPQVADFAPIYRLQGSFSKVNESETSLNASFSLFNLSDEAKRFAVTLPALQVPVGTIRFSPSAEALLYQKIGSVETSNPVFLFSNEGQQKTSVILGDGMWRWKIRDYQEHNSFTLFREILGKSIQWLVLKNDKSPFRIQPPRLLNETESVTFSAEVYNASYERIIEPEVSLNITDEQGRNYPYTFSKQTDRYYLDAGGFPAGSYTYTARVNLTTGSQLRRGVFVVAAVNVELSELEANHLLLRQLSEKTKGAFFTLDNGENVLNRLQQAETIKQINYTEHSTEPLIAFKWLFVCILILLSLEWFIRKQFLPI